MKRLALISVAVAALGGGVAYATIPDAGGVIHACYRTDSGAVRLIDAPDQRCLDGEAATDWNVRGPTGPTGPAGPPGPAGSQGPPGLAGSGSFRWRGDYSPFAAYDKDDVVRSDGSSWIATAAVPVACSSGQICAVDGPGTNPSWSLVAAKGETGARGEAGAAGSAGAQGPAGPEGSPGASGYKVVEGSATAIVLGKTSTAVCPPGKFALGGGYFLNTSLALVLSSRPINSGTAWEIVTRSINPVIPLPASLTQRAYAICANVTL
jgi:hypothetical protein